MGASAGVLEAGGVHGVVGQAEDEGQAGACRCLGRLPDVGVGVRAGVVLQAAVAGGFGFGGRRLARR